MPTPATIGNKVRIEMDIETMTRLFSTREFCARELRCLDPQSKRIVQQLCLRACAKNLHLDAA